MKKQKVQKSLLEWATENGARVGNFIISNERFDDRETTRQVIAKQDIHSGQELCFIPNSMLLSETIALQSNIGKALKGNVEHLDMFSEKYPHSFELITLALFMVSELGNPDSHWKPYLDSLPKAYNLPVCWDDQELVMLNGTNLTATNARKKWLRDIHEAVMPLLRTELGRDLEYSELLWGYCSILSRAFPKARSDSDQTNTNETDWLSLSEICMYPMLDMLNHKRSTQIDWIPVEGGIQYITKETFPKGEPVWLSYGSKGNENLLSNYGFVIPNNPDDYFKILLNIHKEDPLYQKRIKIIQDNKLRKDYMVFVNDRKLPPLLEITTRILVANETELDELEKDQTFSTSRLSFLVWHTLWCLMKQRLGEMKPIQGSFDQEHQKLAEIYREGQRVIMEEYMGLLEEKARCLVIEKDQLTQSIFLLEHPGLDMEYGAKCIAAFEELTGEAIDEDTLYCVQLVYQLCNSNSPWHEIFNHHFQNTLDVQAQLGDGYEDAIDLYESLFVPLVEADPSSFPPKWFTKEHVLWANHYLRQCGANISTDYLCALGIQTEPSQTAWVLFPDDKSRFISRPEI